jgi:murein DD-endopeptidase MepM/ murein hydrolase activator NlpD
VDFPLLGKPLPGGKAIATSGYTSARTVGESSGIHGALDFAAARGTPVLAIAEGRVVKASATEHPYTGRYALLEHTFAGGLKLLSRYIHLDRVLPLRTGQLVRKGQQIGTVGSSGAGHYSEHLHLDVRVCGASALAAYKAQFGWPTSERLPVLVSTPGCTVVPAEPLVLVDSYSPRVFRAARAAGIPLATERTDVVTEKTKGGGTVTILIVGAVIVGSAVAAYYVWRGQR